MLSIGFALEAARQLSQMFESFTLLFDLYGANRPFRITIKTQSIQTVLLHAARGKTQRGEGVWEVGRTKYYRFITIGYRRMMRNTYTLAPGDTRAEKD